MDARRLAKLFTTRWWLIALVGLAGVAVAYFVASSQNARISETWESTAPVLILQTSAESDADYENRLRLAESRARLAVEVELSEAPDVYRVQAVTERGRLEFVAVDVTPEVAEELAEGLRAVYLTAEPTDGIVEQLTRNLNDLEVQILALKSDREVLVVATPLDPGVAVELALMQEQLSSLRQRAAALSLAIRFPELGTAVDEEGVPRPAADVRAELAAVRSTIDRLQDDYDVLVVANPNAEGSEESGSLDLLVIDQQLRDLESQYVETALTLEELGGGGTSSVVSNTTEVANVTAIPTSPTRAGLLGLVLGAVLAAIAIVATDRMRSPVHGIENDLALPIVAIVDPGRPGAGSVWAWYTDPGSSASRRRSDIQALRASLDRITADGSVTIGFSGVGASTAAVQALAADVATSMAASGGEVLLMDTVFDEPSELFEYGGKGSGLFDYSNMGKDLADIVTSDPAPELAPEDLKIALGDRDPVTPGLLSVRAGQLGTDPVDALAGRRFRELLDIAADFADVVVVAAPPWGHPETDVLAQRLDHFVLVGRPGTTTAVYVEDAAAELATSRAEAVGLVMLRKRRLVGTGAARQDSGKRRSLGQEQASGTEPEQSIPRSEVHESTDLGSDHRQAPEAADTDALEVAARPSVVPPIDLAPEA